VTLDCRGRSLRHGFLPRLSVFESAAASVTVAVKRGLFPRVSPGAVGEHGDVVRLDDMRRTRGSQACGSRPGAASTCGHLQEEELHERTVRLAAIGGLAITAVAPGTAFAAAQAAPAPPGRADAVFVQTDAVSGNAVAVYDRAADGTLQAAGTYRTGGLGGILNGSMVDHLASQGRWPTTSAARSFRPAGHSR
jgi:hypothetical protein